MNAKLSVRAFGFASGTLWGLAILIVGLVNMKGQGYGQAFLEMASSVYPGYSVDATLRSVFIGTGYGVVDGAIAGAVFAWLYNVSLCCCPLFGENKKTK